MFDYFTRDRSQPYRDDLYNGVDSLTAAMGREQDGYTYIKWRRPLITGNKYLLSLVRLYKPPHFTCSYD